MTIILSGLVAAGNKPYTTVRNYNNTPQALTAATAAIVTGSLIKVPDSGLQVGSQYKLRLCIDKDANGSATSSYVVGVVADGVTPTAALLVAAGAILLTFTKPAGTAAADVGIFEIVVNVLTVGAAVAEAGSINGTFSLTHNLTATGHSTIASNVINVADTSTATILANKAGGTIGVVATTGAADVSSVIWAESELKTPAAAAV